MEDLEKSLINTICESGLDGMQNLGEDVLDSFLKDGVLKEVPIIGSIINLTKIGLGFRDYIFLKKIHKFLSNLKDVSIQEKRNFFNKFETDSKYKKKLGEYLLLIIDKLDDTQKTDLLANAFKAYILNKINYTVLMKLNHGITYLFIGNLDEIVNFYRDENFKISDEALQNLGFTGFVKVGSVYGGTLSAQPTDLGKIFVKYVIEKNYD